MMTYESNLYESLFADSDENDYELDRLKQMFQHLNYEEISRYYDINNYNDSFVATNNSVLIIFHINIQSLLTNMDSMTALFHSLKHPPDIIAVSEHWLTEINKDSLNFPGYKAFHVIRSWGLRGGISLFIRTNIDATAVEKYSYSNSEIEICTVTIKIAKEVYNVVAVYRPQSKYRHIREFSDILSNILRDPKLSKTNTILLGDLNINLLEHQTHQLTSEYLALIQSLHYLPVINKPTRFPQGNQRGNPSLLDHIYVNFTPPSISGIIQYPISDHLPTFINILLPDQHDNVKSKIKFRIFNEVNRQQFTRALCDIEWERLLSNDNDVNSNFDIFYDTFASLYNRHFPITTKVISTRRIKKPMDYQWPHKFN